MNHIRVSLLFVSVTLLVVGQAMAQTAAPGADISAQLQKIMSNPKSGAAMGQVLAVGTLLGCTQKTAGKEATQAFYKEMHAVGNNISAYCKQGNATEARTLLLSTLKANQSSPVYRAALGCYDAQADNLSALAGPETAQTMAHYARWAKDVPAAEKEMKDSDICKPNTLLKGSKNEL